MEAWRNVRDFTPPKDGRRILAYYATWGHGRTAEAHYEVVWWHRDRWRMGEGEPAVPPTYWQPEPKGPIPASPAPASHVKSLEWAR